MQNYTVPCSQFRRLETNVDNVSVIFIKNVDNEAEYEPRNMQFFCYKKIIHAWS